MFTCQSCGVTIGPRISPIMKVVQTRRVEYPRPPDEDGIAREPSVGFETVREQRICAGCAD